MAPRRVNTRIDSPGATPSRKLAHAAALVAFAVYAIGLVASFVLPEPAREELPE